MKPENWNIFTDWPFSKELIIKKFGFENNWDIFDSLSILLFEVFNKKLSEFIRLKKVWDEKLKEFGGEPLNFRWEFFRPLKFKREEDLSDWLIYLISESNIGTFSHNLFNIENMNINDYSKPIRVLREVVIDNYRADILIQWKNRSWTHIEVKIGDQNLLKTFDTAIKLRNRYCGINEKWFDFILLLDYQLCEWRSIIDNYEYSNIDKLIKNEKYLIDNKYLNKKIPDYNKYKNNIKAITWNELVISLRKSLIHSKEPLTWKVWAYTFIGVIEKKLLGFKNDYNKNEIDILYVNIHILNESLKK